MRLSRFVEGMVDVVEVEAEAEVGVVGLVLGRGRARVVRGALRRAGCEGRLVGRRGAFVEELD